MIPGLILNCRPAFYQERFHAAFGDLPWAILDCPITHPEPLSVATPPPAGFDTLIFTSQMGVATFAPDPQWLAKKVFAVGQGTAEAALAAGFTQVYQTGFDIADMRQCLSDETFTSALYPSADEVTADLELEFPGRIRRIVTYRMRPRPDLPPQVTTPALQGIAIIAPLFSRRGTEILTDILGKAGITADNARITAVGISANVFAASRGPWHRQAVADQPTLDSVVAKSAEEIESLGA